MVCAALLLGGCGGRDVFTVPRASRSGGPPQLHGTLLWAGDVLPAGVTTDGVAAALDRPRGAVAAPLDGGDPVLFDPAADFVRAQGRAILSWHDLDVVSGFGDLTVWTAQSGAVAFALGATYLAAIDDAGTHLLATQGSSSDGTTTTIVLGPVDGSAPAPLFAASRLGACAPRAAFASGRFLVTHCPSGSTTVTVSSVDPVTAAATDLLAGAANVIAPLPGDAGLVVLVDAGYEAYLLPVGGGGSRLDLGRAQGAIAPLPDGSAVLLLDRGTLRRVPVAGGAAGAVVLAQGVAALRPISPDGAHVLFQSMLAPRNGYGDLQLGSAVAAAPPLALARTLDATVFGSAYTADSRYAVYVTGANDLFVGLLQAEPVAGGAVAVLGADAWTVRAYAETRIAFDDDFVPVPKRTGLATLRTVDLAPGAPAPAVIATDVDADFFLAATRDRVVFAFDDGSARAGLYVAPLP